MRLSSRILSTIIVATLMLAPIARAQEPAAAPSPAQPQAKSTPANQAKSSTPAKNKARQPATPPKKQEAQKLNPVVVTATRIEQPIADIGKKKNGVAEHTPTTKT